MQIFQQEGDGSVKASQDCTSFVLVVKFGSGEIGVASFEDSIGATKAPGLGVP